MTFGANAEPAVRAFVRDESQCCGFLRFHVDRRAQHVRLVIDVPEAAAAPTLDALAAAFGAEG